MLYADKKLLLRGCQKRIHFLQFKDGVVKFDTTSKKTKIVWGKEFQIYQEKSNFPLKIMNLTDFKRSGLTLFPIQCSF